MSQPGTFIGIDFGTSNSKASWVNPVTNAAEVLHSAEGQDLVPSVVYYGPDEALVGGPALDVLDRAAHLADGRRWDLIGRCVRGIKRNLRRDYLVSLSDGRTVSAVEVAGAIFAKLRADAEIEYARAPLAHAVITHPVAFTPAQRDLLREAAGRAGFTQVDLLEEPVAAALEYSCSGKEAGRGILVYDFGGGTFDLALLVRDDGGTYRVGMECDGDAECGGQDIDLALYRHFAARVGAGADEPVDLGFLRECQRNKEALTASKRCTFLGTIRGKTPADATLDVAGFNALIAPVVERTVAKTCAMLGRAKQNGLTVDQIVLIGGTSRVPLVRERLRAATGMDPRAYGKKDVAVALGAARWGLAKGTADEVRPEVPKAPAGAQPEPQPQPQPARGAPTSALSREPKGYDPSYFGFSRRSKKKDQ